MEPWTTFLTFPPVLEIMPLFVYVYVCVWVCDREYFSTLEKQYISLKKIAGH